MYTCRMNIYIYIHIKIYIYEMLHYTSVDPKNCVWVDSMTGCRVLRANEIAINGSVL